MTSSSQGESPLIPEREVLCAPRAGAKMVADRRKSNPQRRSKMTRPGQPRGDRSNRPPSADDQWLTGYHPVREALRARRRRPSELHLRSGLPRSEVAEVVQLATSAGIPIFEVEVAQLDRLAGAEVNHQGVALRAGPLPELELSELLESTADVKGPRRLVALDGVEDPHNVGAVARVAEASGGLGLILTGRRAPGLTASVSRVSAGAIEWMPVARVPNLARALSTLQSNGFWTVAAVPDADDSLFEVSDRLLTGDLVVILGSEGRGLRPSILARADHRVEIPMLGHVDSLNVSTAGAVILYELLRRAGGSNPIEPS